MKAKKTHIGRMVLALAVLVRGPQAYAQIQAAPGETRFNSGLAHLSGGRVDLAIEEFKAAVKDDAKNPYFRKALGLAYARQRKFSEAIAELKKALELSPYYVDVRNDLGTVLIVSGRRDEGRAELLKVFTDAMNPTPEITARNIAQSYFEDNDCQNAVAWFRTSVERNSSYADGQLGLADSLACLGRGAEAQTVLETALSATNESPEILVALGETYSKQGKIDKAREALEKAQKKDPGGPAGERATKLLGSLEPH